METTKSYADTMHDVRRHNEKISLDWIKRKLMLINDCYIDRFAYSFGPATGALQEIEQGIKILIDQIENFEETECN